MEDELLYQIALSWLYRHQLRNEKALLDHYGSATEVWKHLDVDQMSVAEDKAKKELAFIDKHQIKTYYYKDANYPVRLQQCPDAPILLYGKGALNFNEGKMVSIVGTRMATDRGKELTRQLVLDLGQLVPEVTIISGLAYGIDVAAHRAALEAGIPTIIIPAHGLDRIYPAIHRPVAVQAVKDGGILTEYMSGTEPEKWNFVARNRIVAGLADVVVVVESKARGGSLITARMASDYNRDVFTFPGRATDESSHGCNGLIRDQKAALIENAEDLVRAMQWETECLRTVQTTMSEMVSLSQEQQVLLDKLREEEEGIHINLLVMETKRPYGEVVSDLMMMEMDGIVKALPGGMYRALN